MVCFGENVSLTSAPSPARRAPRKVIGSRSASEAVDRAPLALERVDDVQGGYRHAPGVLRVCDRVPQDVLQEALQNAARLLVDEAADPLHAPAAREPADGGLRDAVDVVPEHLPLPLGAPLAHWNLPRVLRELVTLGALGGGRRHDCPPEGSERDQVSTARGRETA